MEKLAHGIAIVVGFILYTATKNIIIAAVVAMAVEGVVLTILAVLPKIKSNQDRFDAWQAGMADAPPPKKLWWRIALIVTFGIILLVGFISAIESTPNPEIPQGSTGTLLGIIILCIPIVLSALSLKKAKKWNKAIQQRSRADQGEQS